MAPLLLAALLGLTAGACGTENDLDATPLRLPGAERIVAIGDLHGDLDATRRALRVAGAIDARDRWAGGDLVLVQIGDILDRGDDEQAILDLFLRLKSEARAAGGAVHLINGNHELLNAALDFRYVTPGGFTDFADAVEIGEIDSLLAAFPEEQRARVAAFRPGGPYARRLATQPVALMLGENLFVHGGILPEHVDYGLDRLNREASTWLLDQAPEPTWIHASRSPVWTRVYSDGVTLADCDTLWTVLGRLGVERMIVGHTVHDQIIACCDAQIWCIDVGMAAAYGGTIQVLEITQERIRVLRE